MEYMATLEDNAFELAIVDPPYGIGLDFSCNNGPSGKGRAVAQARGKRYQSIHKNKDWNDAIPSPEYFSELHRVSKNQIIWGCNYYAEYIPAVGRIYHDKDTGFEGTKIGFSHGDLASCSLQKRITIFRYRWSGNKQGGTINWSNSGIDGRIHPTQKPVKLYEWLLMNYAEEGDRILDTHLGSGSSAIAAHRLGFDFVGMEIDEEYYNAAVKRFNSITSQLRIPDAI